MVLVAVVGIAIGGRLVQGHRRSPRGPARRPRRPPRPRRPRDPAQEPGADLVPAVAVADGRGRPRRRDRLLVASRRRIRPHRRNPSRSETGPRSVSCPPPGPASDAGAEVEPVAQRPGRRAKRDLRPRDRVGRVGRDLGGLRGRGRVPPTIRASNTMVTTAASSRVYRPTRSPGSTSSPVSSQVSRIAAWLTVSSTSRKPPGCAQSPTPGSMPRRMSTTFPVVGDRERRHHEPRVHVGDVAAGRARQALAVLAVHRPERSGDPHRLQKLSDDASHVGTPRPEARSDERPSGPRSKSSITRGARGCRPRRAPPAR